MKVKLAYLCGSKSWGGLEMNHVRNAVWMKERGHETSFFCVEGTRTESFARDSGLDVKLIGSHKKYYDFKRARQLTHLLRQENFTHLLVRSTSDLSIAATVKYRLKARIHTSYFMEMQLGVKKNHPLHTWRYRYIDLWSCPLHWLKKQVETMTNFSNELLVIPSGLELEQFKNAPNKQDARNYFGINSTAVLFGLIGRFDPQKGQLLLLEAMKIAKNKDFHVLLLGEPTLHEGREYSEAMMTFISENNLPNRVHIHPFMNEIPVFYAAIDWLVMATKAETFGMVTIEALASGRPVLGSNAGGTPEILESGKLGALFESMNAESLAKQIDQLLIERKEVNEELLRKSSKQYDHHRVCELVEKALKISS